MTAMSTSAPSMDDETRQAIELATRLAAQLTTRQADITKWQDYYDGEQPLKFATDDFKQFYGKQFEGFKDNWCAPVVDTTAEKLNWTAVELPDRADGAQVDRSFAEAAAANDFAAELSLAVTESLISRRAFAMVWGDSDDNTQITMESPTEMIVGYDPANRRRRVAALKLWNDERNDYGTLITPTNVWKLQRDREALQPGSAFWVPDKYTVKGSWQPRASLPTSEVWPLPNPLGDVSVVELGNRPRMRDNPISEIEGAAAMQDAVNALWAYLFSAADVAALPQRIVLGATLPKIPVLDKDGKPTGTTQDVDPKTWMKQAGLARIMAFEGKDAKVAQWSSADLAAYTAVIEFCVAHLAAQTRTPAHYFVTGKISNISGDGLTALAQAHLAKVAERARYLGSNVREIAALHHLVRGDKALAAAARAGRTTWEPFESMSPGQIGDMAVKGKQAGMSRAWVAEQFISDPNKLAIELARQRDEQAEQAALDGFTVPSGDA